MRNSDGTLNGDLNDNLPALISGSMARYASSSLDENQTTYDLLPVVINRPPSIIASITETSTPSIKPYSTADASGNHMYIFPDDTVKVNLGTTITLKLEAEQPNIFNVENGIPTIIPSSAGLSYVWKKDGNIITSYIIESLQSELKITNNTLEFINIQPEHAGAYTCEVSNDIATTISETITLEILNLDFDSYFYKNLVQNPYGKSGTDNWESSTSDLITRPFSQTPSQEFARPTAINLFGYTPDMLNPRPYQIDTGVIKGFDMTKDLLKGGAFFTRTRYTYTKKGGTFLIRAYQDIDLTEIEWLIKGGVFGVEGVRAAFSCYIGNALDAFIPTDDLVDPSKRINNKSYLSQYPRISVENFLNSGPANGVSGNVYVTVEEYDNETRLASRILNSDGSTTLKTDRILLYDPWTKRSYSYWNRKYYTKDASGRDKYNLGFESRGDGVDSLLFIADELMPDIERRYTYGQYVEFNKVMIDRLHPNTTKVRVTMHFETNDGRLFNNYKPDYELTDEPFEFHGYERPFKKHTFDRSFPDGWENAITTLLRRLDKNKNRDRIEFEPPANDPRAMVTALNLTLIPILTQNNATTDYYTSQMLSLNDTPASTTPSGLQPGRSYDPYGTSTRRLLVQFRFNVDASSYIDSDDIIRQQCTLEFELRQKYPLETGSAVYPINESTLYPFQKNSRMAIESVSLPLNKSQADSEKSDLLVYIRERFLYRKPAGDPLVILPANKLNDNVNGLGWILNVPAQERLTEPSNDTPTNWQSKARFELNFALPSSSAIYDQTRLEGPSVNAGPGYPSGVPYYLLQSYYLDIDFSSPSGSKVKLSRPTDLFPGDGNAAFEVSHSLTGTGRLICQIPSSLITGSYKKGGMQYEPNIPNGQPISSYNINVNSNPIQSIRALYKNIGDYLKPNQINAKAFYNSLGAQIVAPLNRDLAYLQQIGSGSAVGVPPPILYYRWDYSGQATVGMLPPPTNSLSIYVTNVTAVSSSIVSEQVFYVYVQPGVIGSSLLATVVETPILPSGSLDYLTVSRSFGQPSDPIMYWIYPSAYSSYPQLSRYYTGNTNPLPISKTLSQVSSSAKVGPNLYVWVNNYNNIIESSTPPTTTAIYNDYLIIPIPNTTSGYGDYKYSGSFDYDTILVFSQSLATYIEDKTKPTDETIYKNINEAYISEMSIKIGDVTANCTIVPTNLQEIAKAQFSDGRRPSLYGVKPVDPSVINDGVGSPSYGTDDSGDWTVTYLPIDDSYTKDILPN